MHNKYNFKINKIISFGCSFTQGGGMQNPIYFSWLKKHHPEKLKNYTEQEFYQTYYTDKSYTAMLANLLGCSYENHGRGCSSNELMIDTIHRKTSRILDGSNILVTIQPTFLHRMHVYDSINHEHILFNTPGAITHHEFDDDIPAIEYNSMYLKYFYDDIYELNKYLNSLYTIMDSLLSRNFFVVVVPYISQMGFYYSFLKSMHFCTEFYNVDETQKFSSMAELLYESQLCLKDLPEIHWDDCHANEQGHIQIAKSLLRHIQKYYHEK